MDSKSDGTKEDGKDEHSGSSYIRFFAMIVTAVLVMYALTYVTTFRLGDVYFSETRAYVSLLMGGAMAIIMLAFMLGMYQNRRANIAIFVGGAVVIAISTGLIRSQVTVEDESFMRAMIPHHSIAILTSERAQIDDVRVCELTVAISEAQRREILEMEWLLDDIAENGPATSADDAADREVPKFERAANRDC